MIRESTFSDAWPIVKLGDAVNFLDHMRIPITASDRTAGEYQYYGANGSQGTIDDYIFDESLVLLAEDGGNFGNPDRTIAYIANGKYWVNNHAHVLQPKECIDINYLCRVLEKYDVTPFVKGATRAKLSKTDASRIPIPLPPLSTQKQIAEILEKADQLRKDCQQMEQELNNLAQAAFIDMFGDPVSNPKGWEIKMLGDVCAKITDGTHKTPTYLSEGIKFLSAKNISSGAINWDNTKFISEKEHAELIKRCNPEVGDILLAKSGTIGIAAIVDRDVEFSLFESAALIKYNRSVLLGSFLLFLLNSDRIKEVYRKETKGNSIKHLHLIDIRGLKLPIPPIKLQEQFSEKIRSINNIKGVASRSMIENNEMFNGLMQKAFKGELTLKK